MHALGFTSRLVKTTTFKHSSHTYQQQMTLFLHNVCSLIKTSYTPEQVVVMDVICFWNCGVVLRSYGLKGRYSDPIVFFDFILFP